MSAANGKLKNFNLFLDGVGFAGEAESVTPPALTIATEEFRAGGMDAPVSIGMGMEALELSFSISNLASEARKSFGKPDLPLTLRGALEDLDGTIRPVVINARGQVTGLEDPEFKAGENVSTSYTAKLTYYKFTQSDKVIHEIDIPNMIRIIDGVDQLKEQRNAIGI